MEIERADIQNVAPLDYFLFYIIQSICPENLQNKWKPSTYLHTKGMLWAVWNGEVLHLIL